MNADTIVALITGAPPAGVAWIRLSGPDAFEIAGKLFRPWPERPVGRLALYGHYVHGDDGLALPFEAGHSFTGEETVELSIHGSRASTDQLLHACEVAGARPAKPGEFTLRAFMSGRIDLAQAEAVAETVEAETEWQLRTANLNRSGTLSAAVRELRNSTLDLLAMIEARIDFSEELGDLDFNQVSTECGKIAERLALLNENGKRVHLVRQGYRIALAGLPNAGKSSLLNALLGKDRSIVTEIAGTTRDTVEESADFNGVKVVLIDTAGLRDSEDAVEKLGVARSLEAVEQADRVWYVYDAARGWTSEDDLVVEGLPGKPLIIAAKADLAKPCKGLAVSSKTGEGLTALTRAVETGEASGPAVNERQQAALALALESVRSCQQAASREHPPDLLAVLLQEALTYLGRITGETASADMIDEIFSRFCIGK